MLLFFHYLAKKSNKKRLLTEDVFWLFTPLLEMPRSQVMGLTTLSDGNGSLERRTGLAPELKSSQTFTIILPNLIHKSKKRNLT